MVDGGKSAAEVCPHFAKCGGFFWCEIDGCDGGGNWLSAAQASELKGTEKDRRDPRDGKRLKRQKGREEWEGRV